MQEIIQRIENITKENNKNGKELGELLGLKKSPLTDWKNGKSKPTLEQIIKICDIFAMSADELLGIKEKIDIDEQELLTYYRKCNQGNKQILLNAAKSLQELEQKATDAKSSTLKIG